jgi:hypothetical protein
MDGAVDLRLNLGFVIGIEHVIKGEVRLGNPGLKALPDGHHLRRISDGTHHECCTRHRESFKIAAGQ